VGKTCSALAIAEALPSMRRVIFVSKAALEANFKGQIKECGSQYLRHLNHWVFSTSCVDSEEQRALVTGQLHIPDAAITTNGGAFLIDYTKQGTPNYAALSPHMKTMLNTQIDMMIAERFEFIHSNSSRYHLAITDTYFDNAVVIVDEVHNLINTMATQRTRGLFLYNCFMNARNSKFVLLSGTPLINRVYESAFLFNILRGYMPYIEYKLRGAAGGADMADIKRKIQQNKWVDQVIINRIKKTVRITRNPVHFVTSQVKSQGGVIYTNDDISDAEFEQQMSVIVGRSGFEYTMRQDRDTALPEDEQDFERQFYNTDLNKMKKKELFKMRIAGLTSYYGYLDPALFPQVTKTTLELVPMSVYQQSIYEKIRHDEIVIEKNKQKSLGKTPDEQIPTTFRIHSRFCCSIAFPEALTATDKVELLEQLVSMESAAAADTAPDADTTILPTESIDVSNAMDGEEDITSSTGTSDDATLSDKQQKKERAKLVKNKLIAIFSKNKAQYLDSTNGTLEKYSPKYMRMLSNMRESPGSCLLYSQFSTLQGLYIYSLVLEQTGHYQEFKLVKTNGQWGFDSAIFVKGKKRYIFYTGGVDNELCAIYLRIFNSQWDKLDSSCELLRDQLLEIFEDGQQNLYGGVISVFMTTSKGAEGIDLKNVRQVHIMEPYWQPILMDQVIGRAVRTNSHERLPVKDRTVEVYTYMATILKEQADKIGFVDVRRDICRYHNDALGKYNKVVTTDEFVYILAKRKEDIIKECQLLIKESAFDCSLFYADNRKMEPYMRCLDFPTKDRDEYVFAPGIEDTEELMELSRYKTVDVKLVEFTLGGRTYYYSRTPDVTGVTYIYDDGILKKVRPKPVGKIIFDKQGRKQYALFKKR
jgi:hypothetical protein